MSEVAEVTDIQAAFAQFEKDGSLFSSETPTESVKDPESVPEASEPKSEPETPDPGPDALQSPTDPPTATSEPEKAPEEDDGPKIGFGKTPEADEARGDEFNEDEFDRETKANLSGDEKSDNKFQELRGELKKFKKGEVPSKREAELETQMKDLQDKAARAEELEALNKTLTAGSYELGVKSSAEYQESYETPIAEVNDSMDSIAKEFGISFDLLKDAVLETNGRALVDKIDNMFNEDFDADDPEGVNPKYKAVVSNALLKIQDKYDRAFDAGEKMLSEAKETYEAQAATRTQETQAQREASVQVHRDQVSELENELGKLKMGDSYDGDFKEAMKVARAMNPSDMNPQDAAYATAMGAMAPLLLKERSALLGRIAELEGVKARVDQTKTNLSDGTAPVDTPAGAEDTYESLKARYNI